MVILVLPICDISVACPDNVELEKLIQFGPDSPAAMLLPSANVAINEMLVVLSPIAEHIIHD